MSDILTPTTVAPATMPEREVVSDPTAEYIASSVDYRFFVGDRALPQSIDEAEAMFGPGIYEKMIRTDVNLAAPVRFAKSKVLKGGLAVAPSHKAPAPDEQEGAEKAAKQAKHDQAVECADFVRYSIARPRKPGERIIDVLWEMLDCIYLGNRLAEINTEIATEGPYVGDRVLTSLRPKPRENYAFVVKSLGGVVGICAVVPGVAPMIRQGILFDPASLPNMIAPDKVMVFRFGGKNGDPRGESCFRAAYDPWLERQSLKYEGRKVDKDFAGGRLSAEIDKDAQGNIDPDAIAKTLAKWRSSGVFVGPKGVKGTVHYPAIDPAWFEFRDRTFREEMVMAVIVNARQILSAERGSEKDSGVAQDAGDELIGGIKDLAQSALESQLFYSLVLWKWGKEIADEFCPKAVLGSSISPDFSKNITALASAGYQIDDSQVIPMEEAVGAPTRRPDWQQIRDEKAKAELAQQQANPQQQPASIKFKRGGTVPPKKAA